MPNVDQKPLLQSERYLFAAKSWFNAGKPSIDPIINFISGRTKRLKRRVAKDKEVEKLNRIRNLFPDSLYVNQLNIPQQRIDDFVFFCEVDEEFVALVNKPDRFEIWDFFVKKSPIYLENYGL